MPMQCKQTSNLPLVWRWDELNWSSVHSRDPADNSLVQFNSTYLYSPNSHFFRPWWEGACLKHEKRRNGEITKCIFQFFKRENIKCPKFAQSEFQNPIEASARKHSTHLHRKLEKRHLIFLNTEGEIQLSHAPRTFIAKLWNVLFPRYFGDQIINLDAIHYKSQRHYTANVIVDCY